MQLSVADLTCSRAGRVVLAGVGFDVPAGRALVVTGPNGAGKSSLLRAIAGLLRPTAGRIVLEGGEQDMTVAEQCHFLGHLDASKPTLTVAENLRFWVSFLGGTHSRALPAALDAVGLGDLYDLPAGYLSAGQRRRLSLARLLALKRPVWLLDEPTSSLDADGQERFAALVSGHLADGGIAVAATHMPLGLGDPLTLRLGGKA